MQEVWKIWKETYNRNGGHRIYKISNLGNVLVNDKPYNFYEERYYRVGGKLLHRLVAGLFIPNPNNKPCVDHIDTNTHNNRVDNLRWVTCSENINNPITKQHRSESSKGRIVSEETRQKISVAVKGRKHTDAAKQKMSAANKGKIISEETRQKLSAAHKGKGIGKIWINNGIESKLIYPSDIENYQGYEIGRIDVNKGRKYSAQTKDKLRQSHIGKAVGKIWINNGIESKMIFPQDIDKYIGYVKGRCTK